MVGGSRIRQIGWALVLAVCFALLLALTFKVNAVKSDVRLAERQIIAAQQAKLMLETEFETRASQQQLSDWNAVEFGYSAPRADQYLESERQLAALGTPRPIVALCGTSLRFADRGRKPLDRLAEVGTLSILRLQADQCQSVPIGAKIFFIWQPVKTSH